MVEVHARSREESGVALVECRLRNEGTTAKRVRIESRLDGPTWPPRDGDVADPRWDGDRAEILVGAGRTVGVGFAAPPPAREPPVEVVEAEPVSATGADPDGEPPGARPGDAGNPLAGKRGAAPPEETTVGAVVGELTDPRPPLRGVLTGSRVDTSGDVAVPDEGDPDVVDRASARDREDDPDRATRPGVDGSPSTSSRTTGGRAELPGDWLDVVETRAERLEALAAARTLPAATDAVADAGGLQGVRQHVATARADRDGLLEFAARARTLAGRIEAADVPVETLERLS